MNSKVKLIIAVVLFVIAIGAIAFYFMSNSNRVNDFRGGGRPSNPAPAAPEPEPAP